MDSNYRPLLLRISNHITKANLEKLKFLCSDAIEEAELEEITSSLKLFKALERRELLAIDELSLLRELLTSIECSQLVIEVDDFISRRELELLGLKRLCQKRKQGTPCRKNHTRPSVEPGCTEKGLAAACGYEGCSGTNIIECDHKQTNELHTHGCHPCCCYSHHSSFEQRKPGELHLTIGLKLAAVGAWVAGTAFILKRYINDPKTLTQLFNTVVLPSGVLVKYICEGSILCILEASDLHGVHTLWQNYESGLLKKSLEDLLLTEDLCKLAKGGEIVMDVVLDKGMYWDVCLELMKNKAEVDKVYKGVDSQPRRLSDPMVSGLGKPESTFQEESLRIMANTERKRRLEAEKRLEKHISGQNLDLVFPELHPFYTGTISEDVGDDSSSNASTWDEEEVLDWEDDNDPSMEFWSSIKGGLKEKPWTNFEDAINKEFPDDIKRGGPPLLKFLAYVLKVNYDKRTTQNVSLRNFIRMSRWFGSFIKGSQSSCLTKMISLMEHSVSAGSHGKKTSWFAGYMTEEEAKEKLRNEKAGTFLVRFNASMVAPGFVLSKKFRGSDIVAQFNIEVHKNTGHVEFGDRTFHSLPSLVRELRESWMTDLQPFYSTVGMVGVESTLQAADD